MSFTDVKTPTSAHIDYIDMHKKAAKPVVGTIKLFDEGGIVLIPTPTKDPNDPLNLPIWQKWLILVIVGLYAATGNLMVSGIAAILPAVQASYHSDPKTNDLVTWPAFFMGVGNLIAIPVAHAVGRRPVYLLSTIVLSFGCLWCAYSGTLASHIAGRDIMSIAAGQAEALCPIIVQEIFYLHERGHVIAWFCALQTLGTAALIVASSYLANDLGWRWWYGVFGCLSGAIAVLSILFVVETKYVRTLEALSGQGIEEDGMIVPVTTSTRRELDTANFAPRSFLKSMLPWNGHTNWSEAIDCWKQMFQIIWFPNILWLILINSAGLGIYVLMTALFAGLLVRPPFLWGYEALGYVFAGQVATAIATAIAVPFFCGYLSDLIVKLMSKRNDGISQPEYRLIALVIPLIAILISTVIYGKTAQSPSDWSWAGIAVTLNVEYFGFVGIVVSSFVYCMDAYPQRIDAALVLICSLRGFIGFGISFGAIEFVEKAGYAGAFNICAGIVAALMFLGTFVYSFGTKTRALTQKWAQDE
ncbi:major facilitator superfamily domain-containing protein [Pyrenochaeta sp. MPI-SDFR-AT-0127]|nr:major facilitator superfamily domain-containing protein [Pyrenochaeta sp. MPI-SDFR-AT-0127]